MSSGPPGRRPPRAGLPRHDDLVVRRGVGLKAGYSRYSGSNSPLVSCGDDAAALHRQGDNWPVDRCDRSTVRRGLNL